MEVTKILMNHPGVDLNATNNVRNIVVFTTSIYYDLHVGAPTWEVTLPFMLGIFICSRSLLYLFPCLI